MIAETNNPTNNNGKRHLLHDFSILRRMLLEIRQRINHTMSPTDRLDLEDQHWLISKELVYLARQLRTT